MNTQTLTLLHFISSLPAAVATGGRPGTTVRHSTLQLPTETDARPGAAAGPKPHRAYAWVQLVEHLLWLARGPTCTFLHRAAVRAAAALPVQTLYWAAMELAPPYGSCGLATTSCTLPRASVGLMHAQFAGRPHGACAPPLDPLFYFLV